MEKALQNKQFRKGTDYNQLTLMLSNLGKGDSDKIAAFLFDLGFVAVALSEEHRNDNHIGTPKIIGNVSMMKPIPH